MKFTALWLFTFITLFAQKRFPLEEVRAEGVAIPAPILQTLTALKPCDPQKVRPSPASFFKRLWSAA